jgi:Gluconate 2-dehydrogenase subunit 3
MDRRTTIKTLVIVSAGAALLPACLQENKKPLITLKNFNLTGDQEDMVASLCEAIIPKTDTPGAKDVGAPQFVLMMMDDCYAPDQQSQFAKGLYSFNNFAKKTFGHSFVDCSASEKDSLLSSAEKKSQLDPDAQFFYRNTKRLTLEAFTVSEYYLTRVQVYQLVPGKFYGCVPVQKTS